MRRRVAAVLILSGWAAGCGRDTGPTVRAGEPAGEAAAWVDSVGDGIPDFARLTAESDRQAFRHWSAFLAESMFYRSTAGLPKDVNDCAGLVRFAYREALRRHDGAWADDLRLRAVPPWPGVQHYQDPHTPLKASLFRVTDVEFPGLPPSPADFAEFADARTLMRLNTHLTGRRLETAEPGDLLFYRQLAQSMPFHVMVYLPESYLEPGRPPSVVYHTGPDGQDPGEMRRPTVEELRRHPEPRWHPVPGNRNFLGVFRWNILRDSI
jgi:uncharacterized protein